MIRSIKHRGLKRLYEQNDRGYVRADMVDKLENILFALGNAGGPEGMRLPGFRLHALKGDLRGHWAVTVRANWRVIWRFEDGDACDVDLVDYH